MHRFGCWFFDEVRIYISPQQKAYLWQMTPPKNLISWVYKSHRSLMFIYINIIRSMMSFLYTGYVYSICIPLKSRPQYASKVKFSCQSFQTDSPKWSTCDTSYQFPFLPLCRIKIIPPPVPLGKDDPTVPPEIFFLAGPPSSQRPQFRKGENVPPFEVEKVVRWDLAAWGETMYTCGKWIPSPSWIGCWM